MEQLVLRRSRALVRSAELQSSESQALASHGDNHLGRPHAARLGIAPGLTWPLARLDVDLRKSDNLPATLHENLGCKQLLVLVPGLASNSIQRAFADSHARGVRLGDRRFSRRRGCRDVALTEKTARLICKCRGAFLFVQADRPLGGGSRSRGIRSRPPKLRPPQKRIAGVRPRRP